MGNYCSNSIMIISTEQGIRDFLWWMIKNLENAGLFDGESALRVQQDIAR